MLTLPNAAQLQLGTAIGMRQSCIILLMLLQAYILGFILGGSKTKETRIGYASYVLRYIKGILE